VGGFRVLLQRPDQVDSTDTGHIPVGDYQIETDLLNEFTGRYNSDCLEQPDRGERAFQDPYNDLYVLRMVVDDQNLIHGMGRSC